jgi:chaperonin cofactor prefoldin
MDKTTIRSWDPSAPSLLWAHQIRRENIHLVNQLESTRADLAGAILSIAELKQQLNEVREQAQTANTNHDICAQRLKDITDRLETRLEGMSSRLDVIERENGHLRESLDSIERKCREQTGLAELGKSIQRQVLNEVRAWFRREKEGLRGGVGGPEGGGMYCFICI